MASRKELKQSILLIASELVSEAYIVHKMLDKMNEQEFSDVLVRVAALNNDFLARANRPEPGMKAKAYYAKLRADFDAEVEAIIALLGKH